MQFCSAACCFFPLISAHFMQIVLFLRSQQPATCPHPQLHATSQRRPCKIHVTIILHSTPIFSVWPSGFTTTTLWLLFNSICTCPAELKPLDLTPEKYPVSSKYHADPKNEISANLFPLKPKYSPPYPDLQRPQPLPLPSGIYSNGYTTLI